MSLPTHILYTTPGNNYLFLGSLPECHFAWKNIYESMMAECTHHIVPIEFLKPEVVEHWMDKMKPAMLPEEFPVKIEGDKVYLNTELWNTFRIHRFLLNGIDIYSTTDGDFDSRLSPTQRFVKDFSLDSVECKPPVVCNEYNGKYNMAYYHHIQKLSYEYHSSKDMCPHCGQDSMDEFCHVCGYSNQDGDERYALGVVHYKYANLPFVMPTDTSYMLHILKGHVSAISVSKDHYKDLKYAYVTSYDKDQHKVSVHNLLTGQIDVVELFGGLYALNRVLDKIESHGS